MDKKDKLFFNLVEKNVLVIETKDDYFMIFNKKISKCNQDVYDRYKKIFETNSNSNRSEMNRLKFSVEMAYHTTNKEEWEDLKEFINRLDEKDIDIVRKSYYRYIELKNITLERPHVGFLDGNRIRVYSILKRDTEDEYEVRIQAPNNLFKKISNISPNMVVKFEIINKIDWNVVIIKKSACGGIDNVNKDKDEEIYSADLVIKVLK